MITRTTAHILVLALLSACGAGPSAKPTPALTTASITTTPTTKPPPTDQRPVTDTYHGVKVVDDYRWLEAGSDKEVKAWNAAQNAFARTRLDALPAAKAVRQRLTKILTAESARYWGLSPRPGKLLAIKHQPPKQQPMLVVLPSADRPADEQLVLDPNRLDPTGGTAIDWYVPSFDGELVAVSLSKGGSEVGDLHLFETATGKQVHEVIPRVNGGTAGGSVAWLPDHSGFFYTRYPRSTERSAADLNFYVQIYFHKLGSPIAEDRYEAGKDFPRIAEIELHMDQGSGRLLATVQKGDGGEFALYLRSPQGAWQQFSDYGDKTIQAAFGPKDDLYLLSRQAAPRGKILRQAIKDLGSSKTETIVAQGKDTIVDSFWQPPSVLPTKTRLYVVYQLGGPSEIRVFDLAGKPLAGPTKLPVSAAGGLTSIGKDGVLFENKSFVEPPAWYRFDPKSNETTKTKLAMVSPVDVSNVKVVRAMATSKDGTLVPVNIILRKDAKLDGQNPAVVNGYGGYGVNVTPRFRPYYFALIEQGLIYAVANLRGGGEFGEQWHRQGNLVNKQNVFDDFAAVLELLIARGYTSSPKLATIGGSNGGLLMGATLVQHPGLIKAAVSFVGIYDMLRVEQSPNGAFNVTEFGTVTNPDHFKALFAYSPYHNVIDGTAYPATLMLTGANDPRVDPLQSRKMTARLQAATSSEAPILLRTSDDSGHGLTSSLDERIAQLTDAYAFIFDQLGVEPR
jgi:prolyl oligopeptidase